MQRSGFHTPTGATERLGLRIVLLPGLGGMLQRVIGSRPVQIHNFVSSILILRSDPSGRTK
jgi:hypothetical protein